MKTSQQTFQTGAAESPEQPEQTSQGGAMDKSTSADARADVAASNESDDQLDALQASGQDANARIKDDVIAALKTVYDPEIPVDIYELGLIYEIDIRDEGVAYLKMTLTSPMCPVAEILPVEVEEKARSVDGISRVDLDLVWDPPWDVEMMSESARLELNF